MGYKYLNIECRNKIEVLYKEGYSARKIAKVLGYHHSTISRELKRTGNLYQANKAHHNYTILSKNKGRKSKLTNELKVYIEDKLKSTWSPEQIVGRDLKGIVCTKTIYHWLYKGLLNVSLKTLRRKGKSLNPKETRGKFNIGTTISKRPTDIKKRIEFGHWEIDTMVSSRGKSKGCFATFAEMKTRFYIALKIPDRSKDSMYHAIEKLLVMIPKEAFKSFTSDRGKEFACYEEVEKKYGIDFYFADPYSAWQRGTNENSNGLLRAFFPKRTDLSKVEDIELIESLNKINSRPRKCLEFDTTIERFTRELALLTSVSH